MKIVLLTIAGALALYGCSKPGENTAPSVVAPTVVEPKLPEAPAWELLRSKDEMTDEPRVTAQLVGNKESSRNVLTVRCVGKRLEAFATFSDYLGNESRTVKYRIDQQPPQTEYWSISTTGTAVFSAESADFARQLMPAEKVLIEAEDFRGVAHRAMFEWTKGAKQIGDVLTACNRSIEGLESKIPGLRKKVALEVERWGPKNILTKKQALTAIAGFTEEINDQLTPGFALAVQSFSDEYMAKCRSGKARGTHCDTVKIFSDRKNDDIPWSAGSAIYEAAPKAIKKEMGELRIFD